MTETEQTPKETKKKVRKTEADPHRLLPQSPDAEKGILGSFLIAPRDIGAHCEEQQIRPDIFAIPSHAVIFGELQCMYNEQQPIDFITLTNRLRSKGLLDSCGGAGFVTELFSFIPTAANARYYIEVAKEKHVLRELITTCTQLASRGYDEQDNVQGLVAEAEKAIFALSQSHEKAAKDTHSAHELVVDAMNYLSDLHDRGGELGGLPTGYRELDRKIDGLHPQDMIVIAARPSMGKTALAMNIAEHLAVDARIPVGVFSLEMSAKQLMQRAILSRARVNIARVRQGSMSERDFPAIQMAGNAISQSPIRINDKSGISPAYIAAVTRRWIKEHKIRAIFVDYLQLVRGSKNYKGDNRQAEVSEISSGLKGIAKELNIPVVVLAQLNRNPDQRTGKSRGRPRISDLRESGAIEADADVVGLLSREEMYAETEDERRESEGKALLDIAKQRNGPTGDVELTFIKEYTRFETRAQQDLL
jgi:replicative DNA helicase